MKRSYTYKATLVSIHKRPTSPLYVNCTPVFGNTLSLHVRRYGVDCIRFEDGLNCLMHCLRKFEDGLNCVMHCLRKFEDGLNCVMHCSESLKMVASLRRKLYDRAQDSSPS